MEVKIGSLSEVSHPQIGQVAELVNAKIGKLGNSVNRSYLNSRQYRFKSCPDYNVLFP